MMLHDIGPYHFRPSTPEDEPFARMLYGVTLRSQLPFESSGFDEEQVESLIDFQWGAQTLHYTTNYPQAEISIIERDGAPVGRLLIIEFDDEVRLGDLMILPEHQNNGICTHIMRTYVDLGLSTGRMIRLHVEKSNRAVRLYLREKFVIVEDQSSHWLMEYRPEEAESTAREVGAEGSPAEQ